MTPRSTSSSQAPSRNTWNMIQRPSGETAGVRTSRPFSGDANSRTRPDGRSWMVN